MSRAEIDRFVTDVRGNRELLQELSDGVIGLGHFVDKAKQRGYPYSVEEAKDYIRERHGAAVSDEKLEAVVGGGSTSTNTNVDTQAEAVTAAVEASHAATTTNVGAEAEVGVVAVGVIVAS
jgi:hypothetical protein